MLITHDYIQSLYDKERQRITALVPLTMWAHTPTHLVISKAKASYGMAHRDGRMSISTTFIHTDNVAELTDTIRHEFAHLIAGMEAGHNATWKHTCHLVGAHPNRTAEATGKLAENMKRKWRLQGHFDDGTTVSFQSSHTKQSKYLRYNLKHSAPYRFEGRPISHFTYTRNK